MGARTIHVPARGVVVVVSRHAEGLLDRAGLSADLCSIDEVADRLRTSDRAVVAFGLGDIGQVPTVVTAAKKALVAIAGLIDAGSLAAAQVDQTDKALGNAGVATRTVVEADDGVVTVAPPFDRRELAGPFDIIGDVHGCIEELRTLLDQLGYVEVAGAFTHPAGRTVVFVGDLTDRGPDSPAVLELVLAMHAAGSAMCVIGNHDDKLLRYLVGGNVKPAHGLALTIQQLDEYPNREDLSARTREFLADLPDHLLLDGGDLVVAHAGLKLAYHGKVSKGVRAFALYGETTGKTDAAGFPERLDWAARYDGHAAVVHGHVVIDQAEWKNNVLDIDTGCVFGGRLTALRWPERELISINSVETYWAGTVDR